MGGENTTRWNMHPPGDKTSAWVNSAFVWDSHRAGQPDARSRLAISYFDEAMFIQVIRNGGFRTRQLSNIMPWAYFRNLTDDDLKAIFSYLRTLKPVCHRVDNTEPPTYCKQCRTKHGQGSLN
jgi:hypothetical protein